MTENYYDELGVEPGATRDQIRDAHRRRVADLEAAREKKGVSESQLQANREEVARVRAAWNVLSDPFQRRRRNPRILAYAINQQSPNCSSLTAIYDVFNSASCVKGSHFKSVSLGDRSLRRIDQVFDRLSCGRYSTGGRRESCPRTCNRA